MIVRFDDVSYNTNVENLENMVGIIRERFPNCEFWFAMNLFCKENPFGSVYPDTPFKDREREFFYDVDKVIFEAELPGNVVSHGLLHADHSRLDYQAQEMSVLTSCSMLQTKVFVPPFNRWNEITESICMKNGIDLVKLSDGWLSMEHNAFDAYHALWYMHPWKWTPQTLKNYLDKVKV